VNTEALEAFRQGKKSKPAKALWEPPISSDFRLPPFPQVRWVIGVDQSLAACGAVLIGGTRRVDSLPAFRVMQAWKIATEAPEHVKGFEASLRRAGELNTRFRGFLTASWLDVTGPLELVHETPPPTGVGRMRSPEASLLAALAIRIAADVASDLRLGDMVPAQSHKLFICGNRNATKAEHHAALKKVAADLGVENFDLVTNEATRDAASIALLHFTRPILETR
jgi:hypothetical protein